jgi:hypothetical protein
MPGDDAPVKSIQRLASQDIEVRGKVMEKNDRIRAMCETIAPKVFRLNENRQSEAVDPAGAPPTSSLAAAPARESTLAFLRGILEEVRFALDSPLEGSGFELPVPRCALIANSAALGRAA